MLWCGSLWVTVFGTLWASWIWMSVSFPRLRNISYIISSNNSSAPFLSLFHSHPPGAPVVQLLFCLMLSYGSPKLSSLLKNSLILLLYLGETYCFVIQLTDLCSYFIHSALETLTIFFNCDKLCLVLSYRSNFSLSSHFFSSPCLLRSESILMTITLNSLSDRFLISFIKTFI